MQVYQSNGGKYLLIGLIFICFSSIQAQPKNAPKIFLNCSRGCDFTYIRTELPFVYYMVNVQEADVYIQVARIGTGNGSIEYSMFIEGQKRFEGMTDTVRFLIPPASTWETTRSIVAAELKKIYLPFMVNAGLTPQISYKIETRSVSTEEVDQPDIDPWNYWSFRISGSGSINGEDLYTGLRSSARLTASQVKVEHKFYSDINFSYRQSKFKVGDKVINSITRSSSLSTRYIHAIARKWSLGIFFDISNSSFRNYDINSGISPGIEYSIFPYEDVAKREFTVKYIIGPRYYDYTEATIFGVDKEWLMRHYFRINYRLTEKWGNLNATAIYSTFLHDLGLNRITIYPNMSWNLFRGFSLSVSGSISFIRDQINIPNTAISEEDVLLRIKQLKTNYEYATAIGVSYRFGSSINNIINPRF